MFSGQRSRRASARRSPGTAATELHGPPLEAVRRQVTGEGLTALDPSRLSPARYQSDLDRLSAASFDVLVVGGGIVGAGVALDAATRGLRVALIEACDWGSGTSSRSSKLIHGGLRYLQMLDFALVYQALAERVVLLRIAPHLVRAIPILYPLRRRVIDRSYVGAGVLLYDVMARLSGSGAGIPFHRQLSRRRAHTRAPALRSDVIGAIEFFDGQVDDARYVLSVVRTAAAHGATVANRVKATALLRDGDRVSGARVRQTESGLEFDIHARVVVAATGAWSEEFQDMAGDLSAMRVQPAKGVHLVVPRRCIESETALMLPTDRSVLFVLPWGKHWIIGTTDTPWEHDLGRPAASAADIDYLLDTLNGVLHSPLSRADIESVFVGIRPLIAGAGKETTKLSREHAVGQPLPGLVVISGGKYTTYRVMARDAVDVALEAIGSPAHPSCTERVLLVGAEGFAELECSATELGSARGIESATVSRLIHRYGTNVHDLLRMIDEDPTLSHAIGQSEYLRAEVAYAVSHEGARRLEDVLSLRTRLSMESRERGLDEAAEVAAIMAPLLGWDEQRSEEEVRNYRMYIAAAVASEAAPDDASAAECLRDVAGFPD